MIARTRSSSTRTSPISDAGPTRTFSQPGGSPASAIELREEQRGERRLRRGLEHDRAAGGERGRDLVRDEVEREVEGRDRADDADRLPQREGELPCAGLRRVHRHHLAGELARLDRGEREGGHRARGLDAGGLERLAGLGRDRLRDLLVAAAEVARDADEDLGALVRRQRLPHRRLGGVDRPPGLGGARLRDPPDDVAGVGGAHLDPVAGLDPLAADQQLLLGRCRRHPLSLCSGLWPSGSADRRRRSQPDRAAERLACGDARRRARGAGAERPRRPPRPRSGRGRGRPDGLRHADRRAGLEHRPDGADGRRLARDGVRHDGRPPVRLVDADELQRRRRDLGRASSTSSSRRASR